MFKELDIWMQNIETEYLDACLRAKAAYDKWTVAKREFRKTCVVDAWDIREELKGDYHMYAALKVPANHEEREYQFNDTTIYALIGWLCVDNKFYTQCIATASAKNSTSLYSARRAAVKSFEEELSKHTGWSRFLHDHQVHEADVKLVQGRDEEWIATRAHKDMLRLKQTIEAKIAKICEAIEAVNEECEGYLVKGTNGKIAHLWRILAGGYNIQKLHTRVLVKEVK